ncbi:MULTISPECIES: hypothetical protein [Ruminococcus]|uniref:Antitoxin Phd_YefM, type II toxin-antitoxin system n=1 Tax=Ruminococcus flavefaciens TaxID=1265 RepID=A0A1M7KVL1_RUMFL|nr:MULTISPECIES: hypothetical protein [Ruminococcus]MCR4793918.1 hypothetical protein [Ruminococcus sp.]SHM69515.1 hypothetical protein SAMN04487860_11071 [Ruminococcus flavefaciens]
MISIKSDDFSDNYELFVKLCSITSEPMKLINDKCQDMIVMTAEAFERRKKMLDLREKLLGIDTDECLSSPNTDFEKLGQYINELEKNGE